MPHPVWLDDLPAYPRRDEWSLTPQLPPIATAFEGGNTRQRQRPGDDVQEIQQTLRWTPTQFLAWQTFFAAHGAGRITMPVFLGGTGLESRTVMIIGVPKESKEGLRYAVQMTLRVYPA